MTNPKQRILFPALTALAAALHGHLVPIESFSFPASRRGSANLEFNKVELDSSEITRIAVSYELPGSGGERAVDDDPPADRGDSALARALDGNISFEDVNLRDEARGARPSFDSGSSKIVSLAVHDGDDSDLFGTAPDVSGNGAAVFDELTPSDEADSASHNATYSFLNEYADAGADTITRARVKKPEHQSDSTVSEMRSIVRTR